MPTSPTPAPAPKKGAAETTPAAAPQRRGFLTRALAVIFGAIVALTPLATGLAFFADPLRKRKKRVKPGEPSTNDDVPEGFVKVAKLDALIVGKPESFVVIDDRTDAWNLFPREPLGTVYLLKREDGSLLALSSACPHLGCDVDYQPGRKVYQCPCHNSSFNKDGSIANASSPAARGMDELETHIDPANGQISVRFQKFKSGEPEKTPIE